MDLMGMVVLIRKAKIFMPMEGKGLPIQDDRRTFSPLAKRKGSLTLAKVLVKRTQESIE